jgi:hypothetical protein
MPYEVVNSEFCADYWGVFEVPGTEEPYYRVVWYGGEGGASCNCMAFKYSREMPPTCKHIDRTWKEGCFWNPQWYDGGSRKLRPVHINRDAIPGGECPHCGGPTVAVRIAV